jgi:hypothetical protein
MRDHLDQHVAARFKERFGLVVGLNELLWIEREIEAGHARHLGAQQAVESGGGYGGRRLRHFYALVIGELDVRVVYDRAARRIVSVLPPEWRAPIGAAAARRSPRKHPRDDAYGERSGG